MFFFLAAATIPTLGLISSWSLIISGVGQGRAIPPLRSRGWSWKFTRTLSYLGPWTWAPSANLHRWLPASVLHDYR